MKIIFVGILLCAFSCSANTLPDAELNRIANAIYRIEGGAKTKYPYGIMSVQTSDPRRVCINTIRNNYARWEKAGSPGDFLAYLSEVYCPTHGNNLSPAEKKCNKNWLPNLKKILGVNSYNELHKKMQN